MCHRYASGLRERDDYAGVPSNDKARGPHQDAAVTLTALPPGGWHNTEDYVAKCALGSGRRGRQEGVSGPRTRALKVTEPTFLHRHLVHKPSIQLEKESQ